MNTGLFELTLDGQLLLLGLAGNSSSGKTLLVAAWGTPMLEEFRPEPEFHCVAINADSPDLGWPTSEEQFQGAIIIPPFGIEVRPTDRNSSTSPLRRWFMEEYLINRASYLLAPGSRLVSLVSTGLLSLAQRKDARQLLISRGLRLVAQLPNEALFDTEHAAGSNLVVMEPGAPAEAIIMVDLIDAAELPDPRVLRACLEEQPTPELGVTPVHLSVQNLEGDLRLDPAFYEPAYLALRRPQGFDEHLLGDIAEVIAGVRVDAAERRNEPKPGDIAYVQVRHMQSDIIADNDPFWISLAAVGPHQPKLAMPGDILVSSGGTTGKVVLVGSDQPNGVLFDTSVRRVRLNGATISPSAVADFLRSDLGQLQFRRLTTGTVIPHLTSAHLAQVRVFLPSAAPPQPMPPGQPTAPQAPPPPELSPAQVYARTVQSELQAIRDQIGDGERPGWKETAVEKLRLLAADLAPPPLSERVRQHFPAPLAIAYRRFQMATHNPYEQLDRMIALVEACVYFVFHVLVADYAKAEWRRRIPLPKAATEALRPRATFDNRIQFIRTVTELARTNRLNLFVPKLVDCKIEDFADYFRLNLRNPVAHSAPGSEAYVAKLIQDHHAKLEQMLGELELFANYSMCRVRSHYFQRGRWHYQCELYRGEEYDVNLQEIPLPPGPHASHLITAERDHLVLLSAEYEALDLWPYYQLHYSDATCRESHLCYVKHFTASDKVLHGESVRSGIELPLGGFDDYFRNVTANNQGG